MQQPNLIVWQIAITVLLKKPLVIVYPEVTINVATVTATL